MPDQQHGLVLARSMQPHHDIFLPVIGAWAQHLDIALGKSSIAKTLCHGIGSGAHIPHRICGVDFDQLLEDVVRELLGRIVKLSAATAAKECRTKQ